MSEIVQVTVRIAPTATEQQVVIDNWLQMPAGTRCAGDAAVVIVEGALFDRTGPHDVRIVALGAGCVCCLGLVPFRVALVRVLRRYRPRALLLLVASGAHLPSLRQLLASGRLGVSFELDAPL